MAFGTFSKRLTKTHQALLNSAAQGAATLLQQQENQLLASSGALAAHLSTALPLPIGHKHGSQLFITSEAHASLCNSTQLVTRLATEAQAADQEHSYSSKAPAWKQALDALQAAAQYGSVGREANTTRDGGKQVEQQQQQQQQQQAGDAGHKSEAVEMLRQRWQVEVELLVKSVLVWAQNIQGKEQDGSQETGMSSSRCTDETCLDFYVYMYVHIEVSPWKVPRATSTIAYHSIPYHTIPYPEQRSVSLVLTCRRLAKRSSRQHARFEVQSVEAEDAHQQRQEDTAGPSSLAPLDQLLDQEKQQPTVQATNNQYNMHACAGRTSWCFPTTTVDGASPLLMNCKTNQLDWAEDLAAG